MHVREFKLTFKISFLDISFLDISFLDIKSPKYHIKKLQI